ncbi:LytR/AlgR family response regulator transcription factor [Pedobacter nutrimenti]|jgi:DNA-binding LytR/AlgR family response regulator|uniref:LytTR family two component transcriptional regulator n=1 Tax=Pedobacter nutrimenti TaxID=1241337 RepID=A0A318U9P3_9SPHI|nr:LytTR family DNA-binding domain-containing protein [Pedobacter nutrimenti]PYF69408.1 LytTR family two component transcriptional regulator [Pedobacter nutrimenti]
MIRCIAVDDEAYASEILATYIKRVPFLELVGTTTNPFEALGLIQDGKVDLVFLDIQMPELTGIQFLKICGNKCKVVLTTAYPEYALDGFEHDVIDYLLKPIPFERFYKAAQKAQTILEPAVSAAGAGQRAEGISAVAAKQPVQDYIFVKGESKNKFLKVNYEDILYIEGLKNYISIYTPTQRIVTYQSLRDLEGQLPRPPFYRVHKSYIVALDKIRLVDGNSIYIEDNSIPIGETYREEFFKLIRER